MQYDRIFQTVEEIVNISGQRTLIKDAIQWGLDELTDHDLPYLMSEGQFATIAPVTGGTVSATKGSPTVTGTSTAFVNAMVGRKIRLDSGQAYYRILSVASTTSLTLEVNYEGSTISDKTYSIYKDEYRLAADIDVYKVLRQIEDGISLGSLEATAFDLLDPTPSNQRTARFEVMVGTRLDTNTTGTITGNQNSTALTGTNTTWKSIEGFGRGSRITIGINSYSVKSVNSDTALTLYDRLVAAASGSTFTIILDNMIVLLKDIPDDAQNIYYRYQRIPYSLDADTDIPDLPEKYHMLLVIYAGAWAWATKDKEEAAKWFQRFGRKKARMWQRIGNVSQSRVYRRRSMDERPFINRRGQPIPPSNYGLPLEL